MSTQSQGIGGLIHGRDISQVQESLVKLNLQIKALNQEFVGRIVDQKDMELLNAKVRGELKKFREQIGILETLSAQQSDPGAVAMLNKDVESHRVQMLECQKQFRTNNLQCILKLQNKDRNQLLRDRKGDEDNDGRSVRNSSEPGGGLKQRKRAKDREALASDSGQVGIRRNIIYSGFIF